MWLKQETLTTSRQQVVCFSPSHSYSIAVVHEHPYIHTSPAHFIEYMQNGAANAAIPSVSESLKRVQH